MEGPQFSTLAESQHAIASLRFDVIGMTNADRSQTRARSRDLLRHHRDDHRLRLLAPGARVGDRIEIIAKLNRNTVNAQRVLREAVRAMPEERACKCGDALEHALVTDMKLVPSATKRRLACHPRKNTTQENTVSLLVVGSVAFDGLESPYGKVDRTLGGAASYFAVAASHFAPREPGGASSETTSPPRTPLIFQRPHIEIAGLERAAGKTFFWAGKLHQNMNERTRW